MRGDIAGFCKSEGTPRLTGRFGYRGLSQSLIRSRTRALSDSRPGKHFHGQVTADCQEKEPQAAGMASESAAQELVA